MIELCVWEREKTSAVLCENWPTRSGRIRIPVGVLQRGLNGSLALPFSLVDIVAKVSQVFFNSFNYVDIAFLDCVDFFVGNQFPE